MSNQSEGWDRIFAEKGKFFTQPHESLPEFVDQLKKRGFRRVLDLGCGSGRHLPPLARSGLSVFGLDNSPSGLALAREDLYKEHLQAHLLLGDFRENLPYRDRSFEGLLSTQVVHHAEIRTIRKVISEIERVLLPKGLLFLSVPKDRQQASRFRQIEAGTFVPEDGPEMGIPHHFFEEGELRELLRGFDLFGFHVDTAKHYCVFGWRR
ncbi:MAG: class I SAM-dependent methyltransferase [Acidobacteria bacterium]|nr:MAG: class I SAM-dependent methyltransferase [Acidobacteriota bacterium]